MKATFKRFNANKWAIETCNTDNLDNDNGQEWTEQMFKNYLLSTQMDGKIKDIEII